MRSFTANGRYNEVFFRCSGCSLEICAVAELMIAVAVRF